MSRSFTGVLKPNPILGKDSRLVYSNGKVELGGTPAPRITLLPYEIIVPLPEIASFGPAPINCEDDR